MKFEEQFPILKKRLPIRAKPENHLFSIRNGYKEVYDAEMIELAIQDNCLDKQKVRDVLEDIRKDRCDCKNISESFDKCYMCQLIDKEEKELGL